MKLRIAGKNNIGADILRYAVSRLGTADIVVLPNDDEPERHTWQRSIRQVARELGVREVVQSDLYEVEDLLFLPLEYNQLVRPALFRTTRLFNIHFSHLPRYKGMYTSVWPVRNGETYSGVTLHRIDKGIDTGHILDQRFFPIKLADTARDVYFNYLATAYQLVIDHFEDLLHDKVVTRPQAAVPSSYYSRNSIDWKNITVDFRATAFQVHNFVRSFTFFEYQVPTVLGSPVWKSEITLDPSLGKAGTIVRDDDTSFVVNTIDYNVRLHRMYNGALFEAIAAGDAGQVRELAPRTHDVNLTNRQGWSALMIACYRYQPEMVAALLDAGANINQFNLNGTSVFMYAKDGALNSGKSDLLDTLLHHGADLNWRDFAGNSVLDYCRANGNQEMVTFLEARGAI
jgi:methionyl-tRNA formyltransferase